MNKFILKLPKSVLKNYVSKHFSELTIDDFFEIMNIVEIPSYYYSKNKELNTNSNVLEFALSKDPSAFVFFDIDAFNTACIEKISKVNKDLTSSQILEFPILLSHKEICINALKKYPFLIKKVDEEMVDDEIVEILENAYYDPDEEDFSRINKLLQSEILRKKAVKNNPSIIAKIPVTKKIIDEIILNDITPSKDWFYLNPELRKYQDLLEFAFKKDSSFIVFFKNEYLTLDVALYAVKNGFVASEEDLLFNPNLCTNSFIMEVAIKKDPSLVRYMKKGCYLSFSDMEEASKKYRLTLNDLKENPDLCSLVSIIATYPEFRLYSPLLPEEEKIYQIIRCLSSKEQITHHSFPFLISDFGGNLDYKKLRDLVYKLNIELDETKIIEQKKYYNILNTFIESITDVRYEKEKNTFKYSNIVVLNDDILNKLQLAKESNDKNILDMFVNEIYEFCGFLLDKEYILDKINGFYDSYIDKGYIDLTETSEFCNKVLNEHRNNFKSSNSKIIIEEISNKLELTDKKKQTLQNSTKMLKVSTLIKEQKYKELGISYEEFDMLLDDVINGILKYKDIKKQNLNIDEKVIKEIKNLFNEKGFIDSEDIYYLLQTKDSAACKYIINKFERLKKSFADKIELTDVDLRLLEREKSKINGINYNNFIIANKDTLYKNISNLLLNLNMEQLDKISNNKYIDEILFLLPFIDLVSELSVEQFINILSNYDRVRSKIAAANKLDESKNLSMEIIKNGADLLLLSNAYSSTDDIIICALGKNVAHEVGDYHATEYLDFYKKMMNKVGGYIPPIKCENNNYKLESGVFSDCDRLLIGKKPSNDSCIDLLNPAGVRVYNEVLLEKTGDVVLIRNHMNELISRIFLIRRGNVVQLITRGGENLPISLQKEVADQIISASIENNDNIEYVVINKEAYTFNNFEYKTLTDKRFVQLFGHADICESVLLLSSKSEILGVTENDIKLNFNASPLAFYTKCRKLISYNPTEDEITRLRALYINIMTSNEEKEKLSRDFEPFYKSEYNTVICGEDWYIAEKKDGTLEEVILNNFDDNKYIEISNVKKDIFGLDDIHQIKK